MGNNGAFLIPFESFALRVIASDGTGWEHVSVSLPNRTPNWREMCFIKALFWDEEDVVVQYHPATSQYVNRHENRLHLWWPVGVEMPTPPKELVGSLNFSRFVGDQSGRDTGQILPVWPSWQWWALTPPAR
jgi:hypothetical protein